jgi:hypothetical protein
MEPTRDYLSRLTACASGAPSRLQFIVATNPSLLYPAISVESQPAGPLKDLP